LLRKYQQEILDRQYLQARIADAACELYASSCVLSRLESIVRDHHLSEEQKRRDLKVGRYYLATADRRARQCLAELWENDDDETTAVADAVLAWQQAGLVQAPSP